MGLDRQSTCLIMLGASDFPNSRKFDGSEAFTNARNRINNFFTRNIQLDPNHAILDLFDSEDSPDKIDAKISAFIKDRGDAVTDIVIYYVGHGGYDRATNGFVLTVRSTRDENLAVSSITATSLGGTLSKVANRVRLFVILDCCFSAEMYRLFQSPVIDVISREVSQRFPENGIALLCSSSKDKPSIIVRDGEITMFTEGLDQALLKGSSNIKREYLTLREIANLTYSYIKNDNPGEAVMPEVHTPKMPNGDIADIAHFPNYGFRRGGIAIAYNIDERKAEIELEIINNRLESAIKLFLSYVNDFDEVKEFDMERVIVAADAQELESDKPPKTDLVAYDRYKVARREIYQRILKIINYLRGRKE